MNPMPMSPMHFVRAAILVVGIAALAAPAAASAPSITTAPSALVATGASASIQLAAIGDPPPGSRRRGRRAHGKDKPYQPLAKDPQGESEAAHKDYLKRYGF